MTAETLNDRMKYYYEEVTKTRLVRRMPVVIRLDGRSFHNFTKGFARPTDEVFVKAMNRTMEYLCGNIQGCKIGYTQSDEITLILTDYDKLTTDAWFDYEIQKLCSIAASMATLAFNRAFNNAVIEYKDKEDADPSLMKAYSRASMMGATFDARCFNIPKEEVTNVLWWRQLDCMNNSLLRLAQMHFTQDELNGKGRTQMGHMLKEIGVAPAQELGYVWFGSFKEAKPCWAFFSNGLMIKPIREVIML